METALKMRQQESCTQFEITTNIITKLNTFKLTPAAKLVLLYLTTCYNPKHKEVFPKQKTIADKLGISEVSVTRAICELHKEGLIISERKISNRYVFTSRIVSEQADNLIDDKQQIDRKENIKMIDSYIHEQTRRTKKEQTVKKNLQVDSNSIEFEEFKILKDYAQKNCTSTPEKYLNWILKHKDVQKKILSDYKAKVNEKKRALRSVEETQSQIRMYENMKKDCVTAAQCGCSLKDILNKKRPVV